MFHVGEKVVYPMHGAGVIDSIEDMDVFGDIKKCYIIKMLIGDIKVIIPIKDIDSIGIRLIACKDYEQVMNILKGPCVKMDEKWNVRFRENEQKIKEGDICNLAKVVNYLANMDKKNKLSTWEKKMYCCACEILISELSLIKNLSMEDMKILVDEVLNLC